MEFTYTKHALQRMAERKISREQVESILNGNTKAVQFPSSSIPDVSIVIGEVEHKSEEYIYEQA